MNILVTGFEPFGGADVNPSWLAVKNLPEKINGYDVIKIEVPVVFGKCGQKVLEAIEKYEPKYVINVGQAGGRDKVTPELVAINMRIGKGGDNEGNKPDGEPIKVGGRDAYFSNAPVYSLCKRMADEGYKVGMSMSAGAYICNETFYTVAEALYGTDVLFDFVHVPFIPEQGKTPYMPLEEITSTLLRYIELISG